MAQSERPERPEATEPPCDPELFNFARLVPANADAFNAFTDAFVYMIEGDDHYHLQFCVADLDRARSIHQARLDMQSDPVPSPLAYQMIEGFYRLGLDGDSLPDLAHGWRLGKGNSRVQNRGVELLMLRSDSPDALSVLHCRFRLHPRTGVLLIKSMSKDRKVSYFSRDQEIELEHGQERPLCQRENKIFIGPLKFSLEYTIPLEDGKHGEFVALLNGALAAGGDPLQDSPLAFDFLPSDPSNSLQRNFLLSHKTRACGGFGWIHAAIDTQSGEAAAVKALQLKRSFDREEAVREARMWQDVTGPASVLELSDVWCEHGKAIHDCKVLPEKVFFASKLGRFDFYNRAWRAVPWRDQLTMLYQTLQGLAVLHRQGIMHRDTSCKNMLVMSLNPPQAVIHDFGKAIKASHDKVAQLGPLPYIAPEIDGRFYYTNLIDSWSWAYSVVVSFGYQRTERSKVTPQRLAAIQSDIEDLKYRRPELAKLAQLLQAMLVWDPKYRLSVTKALKHTCWNDCSDRYEEPGEGEIERLKRPKRTDTDSSLTGGNRLVAVATPLVQPSIPDTDPTNDFERTVPTQLI